MRWYNLTANPRVVSSSTTTLYGQYPLLPHATPSGKHGQQIHSDASPLEIGLRAHRAQLSSYFVATTPHSMRREATLEERRHAAELTEFDFTRKGIASLRVLQQLLKEQIQRTAIRFPDFHATVQEWKAYIDLERRGCKEPALSRSWQNGYILWSLLDRQSQYFFNIFHAHKSSSYITAFPTTLTCT